MVRQAQVICAMVPPIHLGAWSMAFELCICYYTFWSGVADLSARYPRARAPEGGGRINRNTTTKGVIKCLLQVARWFGVISWQRSRKRAFSRAPSVYWSVHFRAS